MANKATIKFGEDYSTVKEVSFNTKAELDAYLKGLSDMNGWLDFDYEITEQEDTKTTVLQLSRDEFTNDGDFYDIADTAGALLHREGTADEYVIFKVLNRAEV